MEEIKQMSAPGKAPIVVDLMADSFEVNGKKYWRQESLSVDRYMMFENLEVQLGFGKTFSEIFDQIRKGMDDINRQKQGECYVKLYNLLNGIQDKRNKYPFVMRYAALIFNAEDEDTQVITDAMINKKCEEWKPLAIDPFFSYAITSLPGFKERSLKLTQAILPGPVQSPVS